MVPGRLAHLQVGMLPACGSVWAAPQAWLRAVPARSRENAKMEMTGEMMDGGEQAATLVWCYARFYATTGWERLSHTPPWPPCCIRCHIWVRADGWLPLPASRPAALEDALDFEGLEDETEGVMAQVGAACQQYAGENQCAGKSQCLACLSIGQRCLMPLCLELEGRCTLRLAYCRLLGCSASSHRVVASPGRSYRLLCLPSLALRRCWTRLGWT